MECGGRKDGRVLETREMEMIGDDERLKKKKRKKGGMKIRNLGHLLASFFYLFFIYLFHSTFLRFVLRIVLLTLGYSVMGAQHFFPFFFFFCELEKANYFSSSLLLLTHAKIPCRLVAHVAFLGFVGWVRFTVSGGYPYISYIRCLFKPCRESDFV